MRFDLNEEYRVNLSYMPFILKPFSLNNCIRSIEYNWFFINHKVQSHITSGWESFKINHEFNVHVGINQCVTAKVVMDILVLLTFPVENMFSNTSNSLGVG